ncbi:MAG: hypothetical protein WD795_22010 [Woeseia sp.]
MTTDTNQKPTIISRDDARAAGAMYFYTGKACIHGHVAERYVSGDGGCVECCRESGRKYQAENLEAERERSRKKSQKYRAANLEAERERQRKSARKRRVKLRAAGICYFAGCGQPVSPNRTHCAEHLAWASAYKSNRQATDPTYRAQRNVSHAAREAVKRKSLSISLYIGNTNAERATLRRAHHLAIDGGSMAWQSYVTDECKQDFHELEITRAMAQEFSGAVMALDHIVAITPRKGEPRGLHSPENLQVLPHDDLNAPKSNIPARVYLKKRPDYRKWLLHIPVYESVETLTADQQEELTQQAEADYEYTDRDYFEADKDYTRTIARRRKAK